MGAPAYELPREPKPQPVPPDAGPKPPAEEPPGSPGDPQSEPPKGDPKPNEPTRIVH